LTNGSSGIISLVRKYLKDNPDTDETKIEKTLTNLINLTKKQIGLIELNHDLDIETVTEMFIRINSQGVVLSQADFVMSIIAANEIYGCNVLRKAIDYFCHLSVSPEFFNFIRDNDKEFASTEYFHKMSWLKVENDELYDPSYTGFVEGSIYIRFNRENYPT
jgi:hypothetical protein